MIPADYVWVVWLQEVSDMTGDEVQLRQLQSNFMGHATDNLTKIAYSKLRVRVSNTGDVVFEDAENGWQGNIALLVAVSLNILISTLCGVGMMILVVYFGLKALARLGAGESNGCWWMAAVLDNCLINSIRNMKS
jgi:hypothetical protein